MIENKIGTIIASITPVVWNSSPEKLQFDKVTKNLPVAPMLNKKNME